MNHFFFAYYLHLTYFFCERVGTGRYALLGNLLFMKSTLSKTLKQVSLAIKKLETGKICNSNFFAMSVFVVVYEFLNNSLINSDNQRERIAYHHHSVGLISRKKNCGF